MEGIKKVPVNWIVKGFTKVDQMRKKPNVLGRLILTAGGERRGKVRANNFYYAKRKTILKTKACLR